MTDSDQPGSGVLRELVARGREAFPEVRAPDEQLVPALSRHLRGLSSLEGVYAEELFLAAACAAHDEAALRTFEARYTPDITSGARAIGADPSLADEVRQALLHKLLMGADGKSPRIADYAGRGPLGAWLRVAAVRTGHTLRRDEKRAGGGTDSEEWMDALSRPGTGTPELDAIKQQYAREFDAALRGACVDLGARERAVLRMHFAEGLSIDRIGEAYGVHRATAARWVTRAREQLQQATREKLQAALKVTPSEWDSLLRLVNSQLEISLSSLLPPEVLAELDKAP